MGRRGPLSPEDFMLGRATVDVPAAKFEMGLQLVKRFWLVQNTKEEFWYRWVQEMFPSLLRQKKWFKKKKDVKAGDMVL
jgi:hypothetical protein